MEEGDVHFAPVALLKKLAAWLGIQDQNISNLTGLLPLVKGLLVRLTDCLDTDAMLFRGRTGRIHGWTEDPNCVEWEKDGEFVVDLLPLVIYVEFRDASFGIEGLPDNAYPARPGRACGNLIDAPGTDLKDAFTHSSLTLPVLVI